MRCEKKCVPCEPWIILKAVEYVMVLPAIRCLIASHKSPDMKDLSQIVVAMKDGTMN